MNALNNILIASARAVKMGRDINRDFSFGTMICHITQYPRTCCPEDQLLVQMDDLYRNCMCSDVMLRGEYPYYAWTYFRRHGIELELTDKERAGSQSRHVRFLHVFVLPEHLSDNAC